MPITTIKPEKKLLDNGKFDWVLDLRQVNEFRREKLLEIVMESVKESQNILLRPLPNWLYMSHKQFIALEDDLPMMYQTNDRMFVTPANAMEVWVDEDYQHVELPENDFGADWDEDVELPPYHEVESFRSNTDNRPPEFLRG